MKLKQLIFTAIFIVLCISVGFAQTDREKGIELFNKGDYKGAIEQLKNISKKNPQDFEILYFLGASSIKTSKLKDAENFLEKSVSIKNDFPNSLAAFAYTLILRGKNEKAFPYITKAVELNPNAADNLYVLGLVNLNTGKAENALKEAEKAIKISPKFANAYLLKTEAMEVLADKLLQPDYNKLLEKYGSLTDNFVKFLLYSPTSFGVINLKLKEQTVQEIVVFFNNATETNVISNFKITKQPRANYTDKGRSSGTTGVIRLLVEFLGTGTIGHIAIIKKLGSGLDENAIEAARQMKFIPGTMDGKPVSVLKIVEYRFTLY
jgi:tetratricopeptide (TPR) repeat protein